MHISYWWFLWRALTNSPSFRNHHPILPMEMGLKPQEVSHPNGQLSGPVGGWHRWMWTHRLRHQKKRSQGDAPWHRRPQGSRTRSFKPSIGQGLWTYSRGTGFFWLLWLSPISVPPRGSHSFRMALPSPGLQCSECQDFLPTAYRGLELGFRQPE